MEGQPGMPNYQAPKSTAEKEELDPLVQAHTEFIALPKAEQESSNAAYDLFLATLPESERERYGFTSYEDGVIKFVEYDGDGLVKTLHSMSPEELLKFGQNLAARRTETI